ncbi:MAG: Fe-S cluster assembly ATPase SufC [Candidatus Micrarchaeia archaeon]
MAAGKLEIKNLKASADSKEILKGINLSVGQGEVHAIMGPNGSGKSTLASTILGRPGYAVTAGDVLVGGKSVIGMPTEKIARLGVFLSMQSPAEIGGVSMSSFLRVAHAAMTGLEKPLGAMEFSRLLDSEMKKMGMDPAFASRYVNEGFSGGEKKRAEILQLSLFRPRFAILDETDSGLDVDALKVVAQGINRVRGPDTGILVITHYNRILRYLKPDFVHVLCNGRIAKTGGPALAEEIEETGYQKYCRQ